MAKRKRHPELQPTADSASPKPVEVTFSLHWPHAQEVYVCGDFNQWSPTSLRMIRNGDPSHWEKRLTLPPGRYHYKFVVDGLWLHNPEAPENVPNDFGSFNSVVEGPPMKATQERASVLALLLGLLLLAGCGTTRRGQSWHSWTQTAGPAQQEQLNSEGPENGWSAQR